MLPALSYPLYYRALCGGPWERKKKNEVLERAKSILIKVKASIQVPARHIGYTVVKNPTDQLAEL